MAQHGNLEKLLGFQNDNKNCEEPGMKPKSSEGYKQNTKELDGSLQKQGEICRVFLRET